MKRDRDGSLLTLATGTSTLFIETEDAHVWVVLNCSQVTPDDAVTLGTALSEEAADGTGLLISDAEPRTVLDAVARAGGWAPRASKVFVERDLADLTPEVPPAWRLRQPPRTPSRSFAD